MRIAVFDYKTIPTNPCGGCHLRMLSGLCRDHEFTVFSVEFENPCPERIHWVRIPGFKRPLALLYISFHLLAPLYYLAYRLRHRVRFDLVQMVESNLAFGNLCYAHFCHRAFLKKHGKDAESKGLAAWGRWLDHWLHGLMEPWVFRRVQRIVVPSQGLARELQEEFPFTKGRITVVSNPVDVEKMSMPAGFDRDGFRREKGLGPEDIVLSFVALGHFERKGLPQLLEAMVRLKEPRLKLLVVGGRETLQDEYRKRCRELGLENNVLFAGMQRDVRPFLWASDAFTLPSFYEVFPLVALEAAAAGLPLIVSPLHGVEEFLVDGQNGFLVEPRPDAIHAGLRLFAAADRDRRRAVGANASTSIRRFDLQAFRNGWKQVYAG